MEFLAARPEEAEEFSNYARPLWLDANESLVGGGRRMIEEVCEDWIGPETVRRKMGEGYVFEYLMEGEDRGGFLSYRVLDGDSVEIDKLYIEPGMRGKGYGGRALRRVLDLGREGGCPKAVLVVNSRNLPAISFYENFGFARERSLTYRRGGWPETCLHVMFLDLDSGRP